MIAQPSIPPNLSFYFSVEDLKPNYGRQTNRAFNNQYWKPPNVRDAYIRGPRTLYHYVGGRVFPVGETNPFENVDRQEYIFSTATIFSQEVCTPHLLAVNYDAETVNVRDHGADWPSLSFDHVPAQNTARVYSYVDNMRSQYKIAAPGSDKWIPQLLPPHYNYVPELNNSGQSIPCSNTSAGLIGSLPLLISLAAFSAPPNYLDTVLTRSIQPGAWHKHDYPIGRKLNGIMNVALANL